MPCCGLQPCCARETASSVRTFGLACWKNSAVRSQEPGVVVSLVASVADHRVVRRNRVGVVGRHRRLPLDGEDLMSSGVGDDRHAEVDRAAGLPIPHPIQADQLPGSCLQADL